MLRVSCLRAAHGTVGAVAHLSVGVNNIHYRLKTPYREGTTHVVFEPLDKIAGSDFEPPQADPEGWRAGYPEYFIARLAALVPNPRVNLTRYHGAINNNWRPQPSSARASDPGPTRTASCGDRG